ncbi:MAG: hypothetical protein IKE70_01440 [Bacilli bacterium]|nr:hypothetical protein [Bacilli bacterium]
MDLEELEEARKNIESQIVQKEKERREIEKQIASIEDKRDGKNKGRFGQIRKILNRRRIDNTNELKDLKYELRKKEKNIENLKNKRDEIEEQKEMTALGLYKLEDLMKMDNNSLMEIKEETSLIPYQENEQFKKMEEINTYLSKKENIKQFDSLASKYYLSNKLLDIENKKRNDMLNQLKELIENMNKESIRELTEEEK